MTIDNATQIEFWNGETGHNWVTHDALMEAMLQPIGESVMDTLAPQPGEHVLDIGCGCGHTSLSLAARVGAEGSVPELISPHPCWQLRVTWRLNTARFSLSKQMRKPTLSHQSVMTWSSRALA